MFGSRRSQGEMRLTRCAGDGRVGYRHVAQAGVAAILLCGVVAGCAETPPVANRDERVPDRISMLEQIPSDELAEMRGGFSVAGVDFSFGAVIRTVVDGTTVLETQFTATPDGLTAVQTGPATAPGYVLPGQPGATVTVINGTGEPISLPSQINLNPSVFDEAQGIVINSPTGVTAGLSQFNTTQILNGVLSTASNQNLAQQIEINIALSNFTDFQAQIMTGQAAARIASAVQSGLIAR